MWIMMLCEPYLRQAFEKFKGKNGQDDDAYKQFMAQDWVYTYGVFRALKVANEGSCWNEWKTEDRDWPKTRTSLPATVEEEAKFHCFLQYVFFCQWMKVKERANAAGIEVMGDVPFYVGLDSVDVWAGKDNFLLDTDARPLFIAGVPPDYFSATGQRWGNPRKRDINSGLIELDIVQNYLTLSASTISVRLIPSGRFQLLAQQLLKENGLRLLDMRCWIL